MGIEERTLNLVRSEVDRILTEADAGADSLHTELHALATKVSALEQRLAKLEQRLSDPTETGAAPRSSRSRKQSASGPEHA